MTTASYSLSTATHDRLIAGNAEQLLHEPITLVSGQNLARGTVLGKITASGKYTVSTSAAADGSQNAVAVLVLDTNASAGDKASLAYVRGDFNNTALILGAGHTLASVKASLRSSNIEIITALGGA